MQDRSVIIVGAGPGGSATAVALARRGVPALVLDRAQFPRDKVCGDVVLPAAQDALAALRVDTAALARRAHLCTGARYFAVDGTSVAGEFRDPSGAGRPWWMIR